MKINTKWLLILASFAALDLQASAGSTSKAPYSLLSRLHSNHALGKKPQTLEQRLHAANKAKAYAKFQSENSAAQTAHANSSATAAGKALPMPPAQAPAHDAKQHAELSEQLLRAAQERSYSTMQRLIGENANANAVNGSNHSSLLIICGAPLNKAEKELLEPTIKLLIERGARVDIQSALQWTPLMQAAFYGHLTAVAALLKNYHGFASKELKKARTLARNASIEFVDDYAAYQDIIKALDEKIN